MGLNAFASGRLDVELNDEATPAYGDAFATRPGKHHLLQLPIHCHP